MSDRPNILIVHCHDLGQFLHCYGVETVATPNIDAFAGSGVRFARSFCTAPQCSPSRASIFTGRYPHSNGVMGLCHAEFAWDLYEDEKHLGQYLKEAGYATTGVGTLHETRSGPARCALDEYLPPSRASAAAESAIQLLRRFAQDDRQPFYLQVGFSEPHRMRSALDKDAGFLTDEFGPDTERGVTIPPYLQDTESAREEIAELQGSVRHVDQHFGQIMDALRELGLEESTLVIFTTDHGIALPRAKCSVYDPGLEVAFVLRLPSRDGWNGGKVIESMISNVDYVPTLLELVDIPIPDRVQGRSLAPLLDSGDYDERKEIFGELTYHGYYDPRRCIRTETHKLIVNFSCAPFFMSPSQSYHPRTITVVPPNPAHGFHSLVELYDLVRDPHELENVADEDAYAEVRAELLKRLFEHMEGTSDPLLAGAVPSPRHAEAIGLLRGR